MKAYPLFLRRELIRRRISSPIARPISSKSSSIRAAGYENIAIITDKKTDRS